MVLNFKELLHKDNEKMQKRNLQQNNECFEQKNYPSPELFTQTLGVVAVTISLSGRLNSCVQNFPDDKKVHKLKFWDQN